jgi:hypothetical protein
VQAAEGPTPTLALVQRILAERGTAQFEARALHWSSFFRIHHRHAARLREGRMFIAGDAAHIHSPFGGQGMNTGLHDAWNLAWKLDLVVRGHGNEPLLESYGAERLPVIRQVIETTHLLTRAMGTPNRFAQLLRDTVIPMVSRLAPFQHAFVQRLSELGIAYHGSPIVEGAGERYFDESLRGGQGIGSRFLLIADEQAPPPLEASARQLAAAFPDVVELRRNGRQQVTLVRPDGYVACSGSSRNRDGLATLESARVLLARQTSPDAVAGRRRAATMVRA